MAFRKNETDTIEEKHLHSYSTKHNSRSNKIYKRPILHSDERLLAENEYTIKREKRGCYDGSCHSITHQRDSISRRNYRERSPQSFVKSIRSSDVSFTMPSIIDNLGKYEETGMPLQRNVSPQNKNTNENVTVNLASVTENIHQFRQQNAAVPPIVLPFSHDGNSNRNSVLPKRDNIPHYLHIRRPDKETPVGFNLIRPTAKLTKDLNKGKIGPFTLDFPKSFAISEHQRKQRQHQINIGKETQGYQQYINEVPRKSRSKDHPWTPNPFTQCSTRSWQGVMRMWRRKLHYWDKPVEDENVTTNIESKLKLEPIDPTAIANEEEEGFNSLTIIHNDITFDFDVDNLKREAEDIVDSVDSPENMFDYFENEYTNIKIEQIDSSPPSSIAELSHFRDDLHVDGRSALKLENNNIEINMEPICSPARNCSAQTNEFLEENKMLQKSERRTLKEPQMPTIAQCRDYSHSRMERHTIV